MPFASTPKHATVNVNYYVPKPLQSAKAKSIPSTPNKKRGNMSTLSRMIV